MGINLRLSSSPTGTRNTGPLLMGGGPNLIKRSLFSENAPNLTFSQWYEPGAGSPATSTADYSQMNGIWRSRPFDLDTAGSDGAAIKAREGKRYVWVLGCDHPPTDGFQASGDFYVGYSNDPQIWPDPNGMRILRQVPIASLSDEFGFTQTNWVCYHWPYLVYNPDSGGDKFWIFAESSGSGATRQHQLGLFTTSDFLTSTPVGPVIATTASGGWTSLGYVTRMGVNTWEAITFGNRDGSATSPAYYKYTSSDGLSWTKSSSTVLAGPGDYTTISGQKYLLCRESRTDNDYISLLAVDSSNVSLGTYTRISNAFGPSSGNGSHYPGPTYLQDVWGHEEDGVLTIYASRGFPASGPAYTLNKGPYLGASPSYFDITGSIASNVLTVTDAGGGTLAVGQQLLFLSGQPSITSFGTGSGGTGTYNVSSTSNLSSTSIKIATNGGLWQQFLDLYYYVTDPTAAVDAAPLGVTADCVSGTVTISWNDCLPNRTYRVYRGTTVGAQATLIGDVTGTSITDAPTVGSQYFYKVVTLNSGVEKQSRIVNVYCSNNTLMVTRHVNRVINDGGDTSKIDMTFLASVDSYLTSNDYYKYLTHWADARFGVKLDGSGFVSKVYCLGTTRLPKGGDYTPTTSNTWPSTSSNTSYSATSFRGTTPSWINNASSAHGYFGNGRANTIQRKKETTWIVAYQKPNTNLATMLAMGQFYGIYLQHASGSSGNVTFAMTPPGSGTFTTATMPFSSATAAHVAAGLFDGTNIYCALDGAFSSPVDGSAFANPNNTASQNLFGAYGTSSGQYPILASGGQDTRYNDGGTYNISNQAQFTCAALIVLEKGLAAAVTDITAMYA